MIRRTLDILSLPFIAVIIVIHALFWQLPIGIYRYIKYGEDF